ncbi:branched-chain amino acid transport system II carrier protein [Staphylococcus aureus]|nr:branched-chain amino acid transport system II carrier protein [Staphylococcus aureus]
MMMNKEAIKIGFAYVGIVVGAGFSTGQEVMQFFTFSKLLNPFTLSRSMTFKKIINLCFYNAVIRTFV